MNGSWLDVKLGLRMLAKYPWVSAVAVTGMALAIAIGAGYFSIINLALDSTLPVPGGNRLVAIRARTIAGPDAGREEAVSPTDLVRLRGELTSVSDLGAFREDARNLVTADGRTDVVNVAEMSASAFRLMHATPFLGRALLDEDERPGAPPVVVIGYDQWRREFDANAGVIGARVRLDDTAHTIVGVMPEGFMFPIRHQYWVSLQPTAGDAALERPSLLLFGRFADGVTPAQAQAELAAAGERMAAASPEKAGRVRLEAMPYTQAFTGIEGPREQLALRSFQAGAGVLLLIVAVNVAILIYARTVIRLGEIAVRTALGASRGRVVSQLFLEALVLTTGAAVTGLGIASTAFAIIRSWMKQAPHLDRIPYWFEPILSWAAIAYVLGLAVIAAVVIGVVPALKATGRAVQGRLQQFSARGSGMQLGRLWTVLIVAQVAIAVGVLPAAIHNAQGALSLALRAPAPVANRMLRGTLATAADTSSPATLRADSTDTTLIMQRLEAEPDVAAVTFAGSFPGREQYAEVEAEGTGQIVASSTQVAANLFEVFDVPILHGRAFAATDAQPGATAVIVDQTFADALAPGGNAVGRRIRYLNRTRDGGVEFGSWLEIVGVVPAFATSFTAPVPFASPRPRFYHAAAAGDIHQATLVVSVRSGDPRRFAPRFRTIAASVNPTLKVQDLTSVVDGWNYESRASSIAAFVILAVTGSVLLLSAAGIYSMMSFTVTSRRREIGIRLALGADAWRVLAGVFNRASAQLAAGVSVGIAIAAGLELISGGVTMGGRGFVLLPVVTAVMFAIGLLAALGPLRRGLAVQPTEVLRAD